MIFVGDVFLSQRNVNKIIAMGEQKIFGNIGSVLQNGDVTFGNLECTMSRNGKTTKSPANIKAGKDYILYCPPATASTLQSLGFDILSLANNHTTDYGKGALMETIAAVEKTGIKTVGAGKNISEAKTLKTFEVGGIKIGFLAYSVILPLYADADENHAGVNPGRGWNKKYPDGAINKVLQKDLRDAKSKVDFLVVSVHWGTEHTYALNTMQKSLGHFLIDSGADLIIGHHPHILQGIETYKGKFVFYSLGNFIFEGRGGTARESVIVRITLEGEDVKRIELVPAYLTDGLPVLADDKKAKRILNTIKNLSSNMNTSVNMQDGIAFIQQ